MYKNSQKIPNEQQQSKILNYRVIENQKDQESAQLLRKKYELNKKVKKVRYEPIENQSGSHYTQILLQPNGNIIHGTFSKLQIPLNKRNKVIYIGQEWIDYKILKKQFILRDLQQVYFSGELNARIEPINRGYFRTQTAEMEGDFLEGFTTENVIVKKEEDGYGYSYQKQMQNPETICSDIEQIIQYPIFKSCLEGRWLNQKIIDFYLKQAIDFCKHRNNNKLCKYNDYIINTCDSQDIFSSDVFSQMYHSEDFWKFYQQKYSIDTSQTKNRYSFVMNIQKSHFIVFVLEWNYSIQQYEIILLDSIPIIYLIEKEGETIGKLFQQLFPKLKIQYEIIRKPNVTEQSNGYDCGIHVIYNSLLVYKNSDTSIHQIDMTIRKSQMISKLRRHLYHVMLGNYAHVLLQ